MSGQKNNWLTWRLNTLNIRKNVFCKEIGIHPQHFKWFESKPKQSTTVLNAVAKILKCEPSKFLLFWDNKISEEDLWSKEENSEEIVRLDVLDVNACCGTGIENFTENVIGQQMITLPALRELTSAAPENIKIIKAIGESMIPTIYPNDVVWVDISVKIPTSDGLYVLIIGSDLMIKRIQINPFDMSAVIKSDNPQYEDFKKENYQKITVVGKVIYHMKRMS